MISPTVALAVLCPVKDLAYYREKWDSFELSQTVLHELDRDIAIMEREFEAQGSLDVQPYRDCWNFLTAVRSRAHHQMANH
ncbi:hypothetical protein VPHK469_0140 [Vibrio phage K469]